MQSLSQNTGLTAATEDSSQDIIPTVAGGGGRASFSAEEKQFTSCSRCLLLKPAARIGRQATVLKPEGVAPPRCLRWAKVCEAPGPGTGPSVRQAGPSRALPCGLGSHSHPSAARTRPVPAPQQPSAPTGAARPGSGFRRPEVADAAARTPESARRPAGLSAPREAVSGGRCCPLLLLFLSPSCSPHHSHFGQPGSPSQTLSPPFPGPHRLPNAVGDTAWDALFASNSASALASSRTTSWRRTKAGYRQGRGGGGTLLRLRVRRSAGCVSPGSRRGLQRVGPAGPRPLGKLACSCGDSRGSPWA